MNRFLFILLLALMSFGAKAGELKLMTWGGAGQTGKKIGINEIRIACYRDATACVENAKKVTSDGIKSISISIGKKNSYREVMENAKAYGGAIAADNVPIREISIDDFFDFASGLESDQAAAYIDELIKVIRPLRFGVTIYEDQLDRMAKDQVRFPRNVLMKIDRVALYFHYRGSYQKYGDYLNKVRGLFPRAEIYSGVYNYDRVDYVPCSQEKRERCSDNREVDLFGVTFASQLDAVRRGYVSGIEFYPGNFDDADKWEGWDSEKICSLSRRGACVSNTKKMDEYIVRSLSGGR